MEEGVPPESDDGTPMKLEVVWQWKWADTGVAAGSFSAKAARANPLRWSKGPAATVVGELRGRTEDRAVELRPAGRSEVREFARPHLAADWLEQLQESQASGGDVSSRVVVPVVKVDDVHLYDTTLKSRQRGQLLVTATHLTFYPATQGGRKVSFPLHVVQESRAVSGGGGAVKIEASVLVPGHEQQARIALEFADRTAERDAVLDALRADDSGPSSSAALAAASLDPSVRMGLAASGLARTDDVFSTVLLRDLRRGPASQERVRMVLAVDTLAFVRQQASLPQLDFQKCRFLTDCRCLQEPLSTNPSMAAAAATASAASTVGDGMIVQLWQLTRIKPSDHTEPTAPLQPESWGDAFGVCTQAMPTASSSPGP